MSFTSARPEQTAASRPPPRDIRDLLNLRLALLSSASDGTCQDWLHGEFGLRIVEWRVLGVVAAAGAARFGEVAWTLSMDKGQLSRLVKTLVARGLMTSAPDATDQRTVRLQLTFAGKGLHEQILARALRADEQAVSALTPDESRSLFDLLDKVQHSMVGTGGEEA